MVTNRRVTGTASSMPLGLAMGIGTSLGITLLLSLVTAWLVDSTKLEMTNVGYASMITLLLSAFAGAALAALRVKRQLVMVCGIAGLGYYLCLLAITALFFGGQYQGMGVTALVVLAGCGAAILLQLKGEKPRRARHRKTGFR